MFCSSYIDIAIVITEEGTIETMLASGAARLRKVGRTRGETDLVGKENRQSPFGDLKLFHIMIHKSF